jgi:hypothetical protein
VIDIHTDSLFPLSKGPPDVHPPPSPATLWRWALRGVRGHKLATIVIGGRRYSSRRAFDDFIRALNGPAVTPPPSRLRARQKAVAAARAEETF